MRKVTQRPGCQTLSESVPVRLFVSVLFRQGVMFLSLQVSRDLFVRIIFELYARLWAILHAFLFLVGLDHPDIPPTEHF